MADIWFTLLRWLILVGLAIGVVAVPVVYVNGKIDAAHTAGIDEGRAACVADYAKAAIKAKEASDQTLKEEANKALEAQAKADAANAKANKLQDALKDALKQSNIPAVCVLPEHPTSILREFAAGSSFASDIGPAVPSGPTKAVPGLPPFPRGPNPFVS